MRKYGQHFLINQRVIEGIVAAVPPQARQVVEIGPGQGALTQKLLLHHAAHLTLVEIDPQMQAYLLTHWPALAGHMVLADFLKFDLAALPAEPTFFVSNLPYIDAAEILDKVLSWPYFDGAVFMFQKEQAQRILAPSGAAGYGPLSVLSQLRAEIKPLLKVGKACFTPPPKVESLVLTFAKKQTPFATAEEYRRFARLVQAAFAHKRKTLYNSLVLSGYDKAAVTAALQAAKLAPQVRAETVPLAAFLQLNTQLVLL